MPTSPLIKGTQNASALGDSFTLGQLTVGSATVDASSTNVVISHGLDGTPTWYIVSGADDGTADRVAYVSAASATELTLSQADTDGDTQTVYYIAGILS